MRARFANQRRPVVVGQHHNNDTKKRINRDIIYEQQASEEPASKVAETGPVTDELVTDLLMLVEADGGAPSSIQVGDESERM